MLGVIAGLAIGKKLLLHFSPTKVFTGAALLQATSFLTASLLPEDASFKSFAVLIGFVSGLFIGIGYMAPLLAGQTYFPDRKLLITSLMLVGSATGLFIFSLLSTYLLQTLELPLFEAVRILSYCFFGQAVFAGLCLSIPNHQLGNTDMLFLRHALLNQSSNDRGLLTNDESPEEVRESYEQAKVSRPFITLIVIAVTAQVAPFLLIGGFKAIYALAAK